MRDFIPRIHAAGAEFVILGSGTPEQAGWFVEDYHVPTPVFTDPELGAYRAVGARRGPLAVLDPRTFVAGFRARRKGFRQSRTQGSATQVGGVFVLGPGARTSYRYLSAYAGDHPDPEDAVRALEAATRG